MHVPMLEDVLGDVGQTFQWGLALV